MRDNYPSPPIYSPIFAVEFIFLSQKFSVNFLDKTTRFPLKNELGHHPFASGMTTIYHVAIIKNLLQKSSLLNIFCRKRTEIENILLILQFHK